ncbi:hypothetical protein [Komagataeibacter xylinus]|uniref:Uncharacterized protein n=1 Tax=Komagataeibacter xylinus TaxID=28448 RepID=A0A857FTZ3_KOMXY|nr:hypothetical protein [Komagataeibacter xylinus]QHC35964.1 hypothetical protein FMA36_11095 [Komagataeibacter xylinus]
MRFIILSLVGLFATGIAYAERPKGDGIVEICAAYNPADQEDFQKEFSFGNITIPAGAVFDGTAHMFNGLKDPRDEEHMTDEVAAHGGKIWPSISDAEEKKREDDLRIDRDPGHSHQAFITDDPIKLSKHHLCEKVSAHVMVSSQWDWDARPIDVSASLYYQAYGVVSDNKIDTSFDNEVMAFKWNAQAGTLNASVIKPLNTVYELPPD